MYGCIVWCLIGYFYNHLIVFLGIDNRPRKHAIYCNDVFALTELFNVLDLNLIKPPQAIKQEKYIPRHVHGTCVQTREKETLKS